MNEFIQKNYTLLIHLLEFIAALTGIIFYKKFNYSSYKYFIWFLIYIIICEIIGSYTLYVKDGKFLYFLKGTIIEKNYWWSTIFWKIGAIIFFAFYFNKILKSRQKKTIIRYCALSFLIFSVGYILIHWEAFFTSFFPIISILGSVIIFICTVFYFIETLESDNILSFYKSLNFYISTAIFIWWLIITPIVFYDNYTTYQIDVFQRDWEYIKIRRLLYLSANIFMYSTFTFALIFCKPEKEIDLN